MRGYSGGKPASGRLPRGRPHNRITGRGPLSHENSVPAPNPHDLRRTVATLAVSAGANAKTVQRMLGHAMASMTLDVYADLFDAALDSVAANLVAAIRGVVAIQKTPE
ncbi:tyrosine-type recombinase/integrase [Mycobacterium lacus]|uniref:tyrosine-type recombinase/integrase n=1 Tax=Mycobacterium lacus TaxID=169765 RepID=UPI0035562579